MEKTYMQTPYGKVCVGFKPTSFGIPSFPSVKKDLAVFFCLPVSNRSTGFTRSVKLSTFFFASQEQQKSKELKCEIIQLLVCFFNSLSQKHLRPIKAFHFPSPLHSSSVPSTSQCALGFIVCNLCMVCSLSFT